MDSVPVYPKGRCKMKGIVKIALIISAVLVAVGILLAVVSGFMGGHFSDLWSGRMQMPAFFRFGIRPATPGNEYSKSNTYTVSADGIDAIQIDWISGEVIVTIGETDQIVFSESGAGLAEETALRYAVQGSTLGIHYCDNQNFVNINLPSKQLTVILPATLAVNLREISVGTVSADVTIDDPAFCMDKLDFETVSGNLNAVIDSVGEVELESVSGDLTITSGINKFKAESDSGDISVSGAVNEFEAESVSGNLLLDCRNGVPNELDVDTTSGNVTLHLPQDADLTLEYDTVSGDFDSNRAMNIHGETYTFGNGRGDWNVETVSGDLIVK